MLWLPLLSRVIGSFSGTRAAGPPDWPANAAACSSSRGSAVAVVPGLARSVTDQGVQPSAGSTWKSISPLSLPLASRTSLGLAAEFAAVSCAVCPLAFARYSVVTLSLWSWSMTPKLRVVMHGCPSFAVPGLGTVSVPAWMAVLAAWKNATALQAPTWVNDENVPAMSSPATQLACCRIASGVPDAAGVLAVAGG